METVEVVLPGCKQARQNDPRQQNSQEQPLARKSLFHTETLRCEVDICVEALNIMFTFVPSTADNQPSAEEATMLEGSPHPEGISAVTAGVSSLPCWSALTHSTAV